MAPVLAGLALASGLAGEAKAQPDQAHGGARIEATNYDFLRTKSDLLDGMLANKIPFRVLNLAVTFDHHKDDRGIYLLPTPKGKPNTYANLGDPRVQDLHWIAEYPEYIKYNGDGYLMFTDLKNHKGAYGTGPWDLQNTVFINIKHPPKDFKVWKLKNSALGNTMAVPAHVNRGDAITTVVVPGLAPDQIGAAMPFRSQAQADKMISLWATPTSTNALEPLK